MGAALKVELAKSAVAGGEVDRGAGPLGRGNAIDGEGDRSGIEGATARGREGGAAAAEGDRPDGAAGSGAWISSVNDGATE